MLPNVGSTERLIVFWQNWAYCLRRSCPTPYYVQMYAHFTITGSAVELHCGKAHVQSQWERANFDPHDVKNPETFQIWTWPQWLRPRDPHQCKFSFQSVQRAFSPDRWIITVLWLFPGGTWLYCNSAGFARGVEGVRPPGQKSDPTSKSWTNVLVGGGCKLTPRKPPTGFVHCWCILVLLMLVQ